MKDCSISRRNICKNIAFASSGLLGTSLSAFSQTTPSFPTRPIRVLLPLGPGSSGDTNSRFIAEQLSKKLGQQVICDNKPGGEMVIALQALLQEPADGHTLMFISPSSMFFNPVTIKNWSIDVKGKVRPLVLTTRSQTVYVVRESSPYRTLGELLAAAKPNKKPVSMATFSRYYESAVITLMKKTGSEFNLIPYKGASQAMTDLLGGNVDVFLTDISSVSPMVKAGTVRPLAVASENRLPAFPSTPTVQEAGYPGYEFSIWVGYGIRSETPEPIAQKITSSLLEVIRSKEFGAFNETTGNTDIVGLSGTEFSKLIDRETRTLKEALASARSS